MCILGIAVVVVFPPGASSGTIIVIYKSRSLATVIYQTGFCKLCINIRDDLLLSSFLLFLHLSWSLGANGFGNVYIYDAIGFMRELESHELGMGERCCNQFSTGYFQGIAITSLE